MSRASSLNPKLLKEIVKGVERTTTIGLACAIAKVSEAAFYRWQARGRDILADNPDLDNLTDEECLFVELVESVERAKKLSCLPAIDTIQKAIKSGDVKAAEKLLSRRMPDDFGDFERKEITVKTDSTGEITTGIALIPTMAPELDLAQLLQQQQTDAFQLAKTRTNELSGNDHSKN
ncbi:hypothetical protein [Pseudomonas fluorescens]|uniref:Uncharacterized protein n=1 Tax=Pseudomonas fluorescens TaxID=294 RepID=A0A0F4VEQ4_PSEFL|nr:hypothetical protein [Pseudomonas fluorescens]KJZ67271.1 hypothetical protein VD17_03160 [Pseudomonas fluorescens]